MGTTNTLDLNNRVNALEKAVSGGDSAQANKKDIATEFSTTTAYTAGCFVYYQGKLYQFNAGHAAGAWDPTDVVEANVTDQIVSNKSAIDGLTAADVSYDNTDSGLSATNLQEAVDEAVEKIGSKKMLATVTADGVKTLGQLLDEVYPYRQSGAILQVSDYLLFNTRYSTQYGSTSCDSNGTPILKSAILAASGSKMKFYDSGSNIVTDQTSNVLPSGSVIELYIQQ